MSKAFKIPDAVHARLVAVQEEMKREQGTFVPLHRVIDQLISSHYRLPSTRRALEKALKDAGQKPVEDVNELSAELSA